MQYSKSRSKRKRVLISIFNIVLIVVLVASCGTGGTGGIGGGGGKNNTKGDLMINVASNVEISREEMEADLTDEGAKNYCNFAVSLLKHAIQTGAADQDEQYGNESYAGEAERSASRSNALISPLSVIYAMAMVSNGADGMTRCQLLEALMSGEYTGSITCGTSSTGEGDIYDEMQGNLNKYLRAYLNATRVYDEESGRESKKKSGLNIANSIWIKEDPALEVKPQFLETNGEYFNAGVREIEFNEAARVAINSWIEEHTGGTIKDMLKQVPEDAIMYLVNALAFDGSWWEPYDSWSVRDATFYGEAGEQECELMYGTDYYYLEDDKATGFIKEYTDGNYAFAALLPNQGVDLDSYIDELTGEKVYELLSNPKECDVHTALPKFESDSKMSLVKTFVDMGVRAPFESSEADFTQLGVYAGGEQNIYIGNIFHNTYIKVDELGTKAGAATIVEMTAEGAMEVEVKEVRLDRPFVYMLIDRNENVPIFIGVLRNI